MLRASVSAARASATASSSSSSSAAASRALLLLRAPRALGVPSTALGARLLSAGASASASASGGALGWARRNLTVANVQAHWPQVAAGAGALVVLYGISSASVHVATTLLELDMKQVFYGGFLTGVVTCGGLGLLAVRAWRGVTIQPDAVYRAALTKLARNAVVREHIGGQVRSGTLKAYTVHPGHLSAGEGKRFGWVEPRVQMLFQVVGDKGEGMATCEAVKHRGTISFSVLALDTLAQKGSKSVLILVAGREDKLHVRGTLRGFLQTERAQYVEQDRTEHDEDRLAEQDTLPPGDVTAEGEAAAKEGEAAAAKEGGEGKAK